MELFQVPYQKRAEYIEGLSMIHDIVFPIKKKEAKQPKVE
jgi:hypothetical protein